MLETNGIIGLPLEEARDPSQFLEHFWNENLYKPQSANRLIFNPGTRGQSTTPSS